MKNGEIRKYTTLITLYFAQSMPTSFFSTAIPVIMRMENYSLESIGYLQLVRLPWILKFLWAPILDKTSTGTSHFKKWIIFSEVIYAAVILSAGFLNLQDNLSAIFILIFLSFCIAATQDIATDAFAILILNNREKSLGNSMQTAGNFLGGIVGSGVLLLFYKFLGWQNLLTSIGIMVLLALVPLFLFKNHKSKTPLSSSKKITAFEFVHFFKQKNIGNHVLLLLLFYTSIIGILTMYKPYLVDLGYDIKQIGFISGIFGTALGALIAVPAGLLIRSKGLVFSAWVVLIFNLFFTLYFIAFTWLNQNLLLVYVGAGLLWCAYAVSTVFIYTLGMKTVRSGREGTDFTIQIVLVHVGGLIISVLSGKISDAINYRGFFMLELAFALLNLFIVPVILKKRKLVI